MVTDKGADMTVSDGGIDGGGRGSSSAIDLDTASHGGDGTTCSSFTLRNYRIQECPIIC